MPTTPVDMEALFTELLRTQLPGIRTQAQYDAAMGAIDATRLTLNAIVNGDKDMEEQARRALKLAFEAEARACEIAAKLQGEPEAVGADTREAFAAPAAQFVEAEVSARLLGQLDAITTMTQLRDWYAATESKRRMVVTQRLRNELLDGVRAKHRQLAMETGDGQEAT